ncbi:unnamed protein product [Rhizophagus irregularis]|uniref:Uncharacterized protein n=1 Tax=Rhizophagus irregularis TaxID=588596 RepID=A0A2N1ME34_9GLOM|nr:hypothetical protein RhiirC2_794142 [Rhizophagus irregularis]CAB4387670.1 unnamed protein product [Rhizophagus irregularis]CAB5393058.1 unnamed protein product [Rhizophagus irregularis]
MSTTDYSIVLSVRNLISSCLDIFFCLKERSRHFSVVFVSSSFTGFIQKVVLNPSSVVTSIGDSINIDFKTIPQVKRVQVIGLRIELNEQSIYRSCGQKNIESKILSVYRINNNNNNSSHFHR